MNSKKKSNLSKSKQAKPARAIGYAPVAMSRSVQSNPNPSIRSSSKCATVTHTEYFASVTSASTSYAVVSYPVNPGVGSIFPWLSQVAQRYQTYKFRSLVFNYHTRAATSQVGTVGLVFDFSATDPAPSSQMLALSYRDKVADSPWKEMNFRLDLAQGDHLASRFIRSGLPTGSYDLKTMDLGNLHVFTDGVAASDNLGLLEVTYVVELYTPQMVFGVGGEFTASGSLSATALFGTTWAIDSQAFLPFSRTSTSVITFDQSFEGMIGFILQGTGLTANYAPVAANGSASVSGQIKDSGSTIVTGLIRCKSVPGTTWTPTISATTVTLVEYFVARAGFDQLG
jgi:hypothetical protein